MHGIIVISFTLMTLSSAIARDADQLRKQLTNTIANLASVAFQNNFDVDAGLTYTSNIQVIPSTRCFVRLRVGRSITMNAEPKPSFDRKYEHS